MQAILVLARQRCERPHQHLIAVVSEHQMSVRGIQFPAFDMNGSPVDRLKRRLDPARHDELVEAGNECSGHRRRSMGPGPATL